MSEMLNIWISGYSRLGNEVTKNAIDWLVLDLLHPIMKDHTTWQA